MSKRKPGVTLGMVVLAGVLSVGLGCAKGRWTRADYHLSYDLKVLDTLIDMVNLYKSGLRVLHISKKGEKLSDEQSGNKEFLEDYLQDVDHSFHSLTGADLETAVQCFTESRDIDMIAMVAKNLNFFQRILFRPKVELISYHTDIPFLVLHE